MFQLDKAVEIVGAKTSQARLVGGKKNNLPSSSVSCPTFRGKSVKTKSDIFGVGYSKKSDIVTAQQH